MTKPSVGSALWRVAVAAALAGAVTVAHADDDRGDRHYEKHHEKHDGKVHLSKRPKTIVVDNLDTFVLSKGDPEVAALAQEVCADCHSTDYPATQPKLSCAVWAKEIVKMGNTFDGYMPWQEDGVTYSMLNTVLVYLADNYGQGSADCDMSVVRAVPGLND